MQTVAPARVAVLGAGQLGIDLIAKISRSPTLTCVLVAGRDRRSVGLRRALAMGCAVADGGVDSVLDAGVDAELVFDTSDAAEHAHHWRMLRPTGATLLNLTPAPLATMVVPAVNGAAAAGLRHLSLVSCGGQAAIPLVHAIARHAAVDAVDYVELVCTAASGTAGRATRLNLDEYLATTREAVIRLGGARESKVMANLSPALPAPPFRVTATIVTSGPPPASIAATVAAAARRVQRYAPGYRLSCTVTGNRIVLAVQVTAPDSPAGPHAGNLELITAAAVLVAEQHADRRRARTAAGSGAVR